MADTRQGLCPRSQSLTVPGYREQPQGASPKERVRTGASFPPCSPIHPALPHQPSTHSGTCRPPSAKQALVQHEPLQTTNRTPEACSAAPCPLPPKQTRPAGLPTASPKQPWSLPSHSTPLLLPSPWSERPRAPAWTAVAALSAHPQPCWLSCTHLPQCRGHRSQRVIWKQEGLSSFLTIQQATTPLASRPLGSENISVWLPAPRLFPGSVSGAVWRYSPALPPAEHRPMLPFLLDTVTHPSDPQRHFLHTSSRKPAISDIPGYGRRPVPTHYDNSRCPPSRTERACSFVSVSQLTPPGAAPAHCDCPPGLCQLRKTATFNTESSCVSG